jgi:hypothetical protein
MLKRVSDLHATHRYCILCVCLCLSTCLFLCRGLTPAQADFKFLDRACRLEMYGVHCYPVMDPTHGMVRIAVSWAGLSVYNGHYPDHVRCLGLPWLVLLLFACLPACLTTCPSVCVCLCLSVRLSVRP